ncbi:putative peptidoglycan lipid II flippase [Nocardia amikacinitolerans]|uniref:murein biosynthesis integral membrane protein MurJ n=1 Tax=Nocardia amikacinitolerans TaxID=756689 RepID=UPI0020A576DD|nr:lipid II flippase MurJ [Nocardia amikacinitolerans]MCP2294911.1 putative peptidoglycan lipid II flippase [Nocardia amikacinitolerans]
MTHRDPYGEYPRVPRVSRPSGPPQGGRMAPPSGPMPAQRGPLPGQSGPMPAQRGPAGRPPVPPQRPGAAPHPGQRQYPPQPSQGPRPAPPGRPLPPVPPVPPSPTQRPPAPPEGRPAPPRVPHGQGEPIPRTPAPPQRFAPPPKYAPQEPNPAPLRGRPAAAVRDTPPPASRPRTQEWAVAEAEPEPTETKESASSRLLRDSGSIAIATLISRITGFGKQLLLAAVLGPAIASAFTSASLIPNMITELVLGAVLTAMVVPTLVRAEKEDADGGAAFVRRLVTAAFVVLMGATLLATAAAPLLATHVFVSADGKVNTQLTTALTFLLLPAILFYGMSALFTAILNTRQVFKPGAWAPVLNNVVMLAVLGLYAVTPGEITLDPVSMSDPKLLVLGIGVTLGVFTQAAALLPAIRREGIDLRPLWGVDTRLKQFGVMGAAIILYVLISQVGLVFANHVASTADEAGPAIYSLAWLLLQLPYGVLGVTVLTAIMPRLSRNAAEGDTPAVVDDLSVATRLTMIALFPVVTFLTLAGPQLGEALFGYARFTGDAERLGYAVSWSAFALIPYALVLIHLRVFYAREQAWTPTWIILGITAVKIALSALAPFIADNSDQVVIVLGVANGLGFTAGAIIGGYLLHRSLGDLRMANVGRTVTRVVLASVAGGAVMLIVDKVLGLERLSESMGGPGSLIRVMITAIVMFATAFGLMRLAGIPEIVAITVAISRRLGITPPAPDLDLEGPVEDDYATQVFRRPDPYMYSGFDPYLDSQATMVLPVIRPDAVDRTGRGEFPYPVRQRSTSGEFAGTSTYQGEGGMRVSDDAAVGGVPAADPSATKAGGLSTDHPPAAENPSDPQHPNAGPDTPPSADGQHSPRETHHQAPQRDPMYDTGMIPIPQLPPAGAEATGARRTPRGPKLIPGASVAGGRYRLLASHGGARGLKFWQALDIKLDREVALTFVDADQKAADNSGHDGPQAILSRTLRLGRINSPGLARVLDVVRGSSGGIVVAEWTPGRSLREMAETVPSPIGAARAIRALASAAELAHRGGGSLSIDHPDRVRISATGDAVLAFPGTLGDSDAQSDVRGLGAMLYALITARWPIRSGGLTGTAATVGGLRLADFGPDGTPVEPRQIRPEVPFEISAVAVRSLESNKGVRTAATVQHVLEQASVVDQKTDFIPVLRLGQRAQPVNADDSLADPELLAAERERSQRMMWIMVGLGILAALVVGIVIWWMVSVFAPGASDAPIDESRNIGLTTNSSVSPTTPPGAVPSNPAAGGVPVPVTNATVFSPEGTPDNVSGVGAVLDDDPATVWRSDQYFQQFPALKKGVGLLATLPSPAKLTNVSITSPSPGTSVEIRTSPTNSPTLDQTQLIGAAQLVDGVTEIPVSADQSARYVLVWITGLGNSGNQFQTTIADLRFDAAP